MDISFFSLIFSAGVLTFFSPCAAGLFPAYLGYLIGLRSKGAISSGLLAGLLAGLGSSITFLILGFLSSIFISEIMNVWSILEPILGGALILFGILLISPIEFTLPFKLPSPRAGGSFFFGSILYGVLYALASLSCSFPVFMLVVFTSAGESGLAGILLSFSIYSLGLILPMMAVSFLTVYSRNLIGRIFKNIFPWLEKVSGILLIIAGIYLILR